MQKMSPRNKKTNLKKLLLIILITLPIIGVVFVVFRQRIQNNTQTAQTNGLGQKIDYSPPTQEEKSAGDSQKQLIVEKESQQSKTQTTATKTVSPVITDAGYYDGNIEVRGYVPGIFEDGGTCLVTLSNNNATITKNIAARKGATTTDCPVVTIARNEASAGTWNVALSYQSATAQGSSIGAKVAVP